MKRLFLLLSITTLLYCSSSDDNGSVPNNTNHLVKREYSSSNIFYDYSYNEDGYLTKIIDKYLPEGIDSETNFIYQSNKIISSEITSNLSGHYTTFNYTYDNSDRLIGVTITRNWESIQTTTLTYTYGSNNITVNINSSGESNVITLETNNNGLVTKMINSQHYAIISYDNNQNISEVNVYDSNNILTHTSQYAYDNNTNPFYGQLKSIYLLRFYYAFSDAEIGEFVWDGYEGYFFPFSRNNITSVYENGSLSRSYEYSFDSENYPINVVQIWQGLNTFEYSIEYFD